MAPPMMMISALLGQIAEQRQFGGNLCPADNGHQAAFGV
jgi:hypothetical protein